jgi:acyl-CoA thioesterase
MLFSETLATLSAQDAGFNADVGADWGQGRATFGGMVAALGNDVMRRQVPAERALRALDVTFVAPVAAGAVYIEATVLRAGRAVTLVQAHVHSGGGIACILTGVYGMPRQSSVRVEPKTLPAVPPADAIADIPVPPDLSLPAFLQHFGLRWAEGARPFVGSTLSRSKAWVRHRDPAPTTECHVLALIDVIPTPLLQMLSAPAPASSLTWSMEFLRQEFSFAPQAWWRIDTDIDAAADGYVSQSSVFVDPDGRPAALSRQLVTVFG